MKKRPKFTVNDQLGQPIGRDAISRKIRRTIYGAIGIIAAFIILWIWQLNPHRFQAPTPLGTYIGHIGFSGAFMFYWQEQDLVITGSVNQTKFDVTEMVLRLSQPLIAN